MIRTRISVEQGKKKEDKFYKTFAQTVKVIRRYENNKSLYRGFILSNIINLPYTLTFLLSYELLREQKENGINNMIFNAFGVVSLCGFLAQGLVYPFDTVRYFLYNLTAY